MVLDNNLVSTTLKQHINNTQSTKTFDVNTFKVGLITHV